MCQQRCFPNCLKIAEIIPLYKKDDINKATNYGKNGIKTNGKNDIFSIIFLP